MKNQHTHTRAHTSKALHIIQKPDTGRSIKRYEESTFLMSTAVVLSVPQHPGVYK